MSNKKETMKKTSKEVRQSYQEYRAWLVENEDGSVKGYRIEYNGVTLWLDAELYTEKRHRIQETDKDGNTRTAIRSYKYYPVTILPKNNGTSKADKAL